MFIIQCTLSREPADCRFYRLSQASVLFTYYSGEPDPSQLMLTQAKGLNISVYLGLPQPPNNIRKIMTMFMFLEKPLIIYSFIYIYFELLIIL